MYTEKIKIATQNALSCKLDFHERRGDQFLGLGLQTSATSVPKKTAAGIPAALQRTPRWMEQRGCGYSLRLWTDQIRFVLKILQTGKVPLGKVYLQEADGQLEEWNFDLS